LAITAIEETVKALVASYRHSAEPAARHKDSLFQHRDKHFLAAGPSVPIGSRLAEAIGADRVGSLMNDLREGRLVNLRESSLYFDHNGVQPHIPNVAVTTKKAREILLLAVEIFDDALVGSTNRSFERGTEADLIFKRWA
jgi:AbiV family abortive infection protein